MRFTPHMHQVHPSKPPHTHARCCIGRCPHTHAPTHTHARVHIHTCTHTHTCTICDCRPAQHIRWAVAGVCPRSLPWGVSRSLLSSPIRLVGWLYLRLRSECFPAHRCGWLVIVWGEGSVRVGGNSGQIASKLEVWCVGTGHKGCRQLSTPSSVLARPVGGFEAR